jgi:transcription antitermination factor NusG
MTPAHPTSRGLRRIADWLLCDRLGVDLPWCVVVVRPGRETAVQAELALAGWSTYLPMQTMWVCKRPHRHRVNRPLFARYLFAACNAGGDLAATSASEDVTAVRRSDSGKSVVSPVLLARLMLTELAHGLDLTYEKPRAAKKALACGQPVKVRAGVLNGFDAMIVKVLSEREVVARVLLFGNLIEPTFQTAGLEAA